MSKNNKYLSNTFVLFNNALLKNTNLRWIKSVFYYIDAVLLLFVKKPKKTEGKKKKIVICYNMALGDGAILVPSLKNIREIYPKQDYEITFFCQKGLQKIYEKLDLFDRVIPLNFTDSTINLKNRITTIKQLRSEYYNISLDPIGVEECTMNVLMNRVICADKKVAIMNTAKKIYCPKRIYKKVYTDIIKINNDKISYLEQYYEFFNNLSNKKFPVQFSELPSEKITQDVPKEYFIVYPSASSEYKRWPIERFAELTRKVYEVLNIPVMLCGTKVDEKINNELKEKIKEIPIIDMTNKTNILEYIELIKNAKFLIVNDTGIYHIATISQVPVAIISGGYTYHKYLKYQFKNCDNFRKPIVITSKDTQCFNCDNRCKYKAKIKNTWPCLDSISVEDAWKIIKDKIK